MLVIRPNLPAGAKYKCVFGSAPPTDAELKPHGLECRTPNTNSRPLIPEGQDSVQVDLAVRSSETNKDFVSRSFSYFNCSHHTRCKTCVKSSFGCSWCLVDNLCVHDTSICNSSSIISGEKVGLLHMMHQNPAQMSNHGSGFCPRFRNSPDQLLFPNNVARRMRVEMENLPKQISRSEVHCIIAIEDSTFKVSAMVDGRFIICDEAKVSYMMILNSTIINTLVEFGYNEIL